VADPIQGNRRAGICYVKNFHTFARWIIRHCPQPRDEV
jgi:hypothetical protein